MNNENIVISCILKCFIYFFFERRIRLSKAHINNFSTIIYSIINGIDNNVLVERPQISTWLEIGASTSTLDLDLPASFSNYGKKSVHLFAPGFKINSTIPENKYEALSGTSMACPTVAGVAALAWSQMPSMSAKQIKKILQKTAIDYQGTAVKLPGSTVEVPFLDLSEAGAVVNAFSATQMVLWVKE